MLNARVIFKKETQEAMNKPLSKVAKGELRIKRLKELDESGYLSRASSRAEVGNMVGIEPYKSAWTWTSNMIRKGILKEVLVGKTKDGMSEYEYHIASTPVKEVSYGPTIKNTRNKRELGKRLFEKLEELEASGKLQNATTRAEVAKMAGHPDKRLGYTWVVNLVRRGHLKEELLLTDHNGKKIYQYSLTGTKPVFGNPKAAKKLLTDTERKPVIWTDEHVDIDTATTVATLSPIKIEITKGDIVIKIEAPNYDKAGELVKTLLKGE